MEKTAKTRSTFSSEKSKVFYKFKSSVYFDPWDLSTFFTQVPVHFMKVHVHENDTFI